MVRDGECTVDPLYLLPSITMSVGTLFTVLTQLTCVCGGVEVIVQTNVTCLPTVTLYSGSCVMTVGIPEIRKIIEKKRKKEKKLSKRVNQNNTTCIFL